MRIAYVSADFGIPVFGDKGASIHIQEMVKAFAALGHDVNLIATRLGTPPGSFAAEVSKVLTGPQDAEALASGSGGERLFKERRYLELGRAVALDIERRHARQPFDFIYERYSLWSAAGVRATRKLGIPCIVEMNAPLLLEQRRYRQLVLETEAESIEREVFSGADEIHAVSDAVRNYAISRGASPGTTFVQPNGVNLSSFSPDGEIAEVGNCIGPVIGFSGSLKPWHGLEDLLEAFLILQKSKGDCRLLIIGEGPMRGWIEGFTQGTRLRDRVTLTGWQPYEKLPSFIRRMDVAVAPYPSIDDFYFSPLKLFEYLACGRAVVASGIGQIAETIDNGRNGLLCRPSDPDHLAASIATLIENDAMRSSLGHEAAASMRGRSWNDTAARIVAAVEASRMRPGPKRVSR
jgi:glycosyltransferase involved in cell wall biosynthesis